MHGSTQLPPPIETYLDWILDGSSNPAIEANPLPLSRLKELKGRLVEALPQSSIEEQEIKAYVLNFLSFLESEETIFSISDPPTSPSSLVKRVEAFKFLDHVGPTAHILDTTVLRMAHVGQHLTGNSYFMESFFERFFQLEIKDQLYLFQKQPGLEDYLELQTPLLDLLQNPNTTLSSLLQDNDWVTKVGAGKVLRDVLILGCGPLKEFLFLYKDKLEQILQELDEDIFTEIFEKCHFLERYTKHPDIPCAFVLRFCLETKIGPKSSARLQSMISILNSYRDGEKLCSLILRPDSTLAILAQTFWRLQNPLTPYNLEKFPLSTFLCEAEHSFFASIKDPLHLKKYPTHFPMADFALLSGLEKKMYLEKAILSHKYLLYFLEQQPQVLNQILTLFCRQMHDEGKERAKINESLLRFLFEERFHQEVDFRHIFRSLDLEIFSSLETYIKKLATRKWDISQLSPLERFYSYLSPAEKVSLLLYRSCDDQSYLYEAIQSSPLGEQFQDILPIFKLFEQIDQKEKLSLAFEALVPFGDADEVLYSFARSSHFKTLLVTFGRDLLIELYEKGAISSETLFLFAQILPLPLFLQITQEGNFSQNLKYFSKKNLHFNGENIPIENHLSNLLYAGHDRYTTHFLEILRDKFLGDGKFLVAMCRYFPENLNYRKIFQLLPSDLFLYVVHLLPESRLHALLCPTFQPAILKTLRLMEPKCKDWFSEHYKEWTCFAVPPFETVQEKLQALAQLNTFENKMSRLEEIKTDLSLHIAKQDALMQVIQRLQKEDTDSPLGSQLRCDLDRIAPHIERYKAILKEIPDEPELYCCISGAFLKNPVHIDQDQSKAIFELSYLQEILDKNGKKIKRARWPHLPSNLFSLEDIIPIAGEEKEKFDRLTTELENSVNKFITRFR